MKCSGTIFICDECGRQKVNTGYDPDLPEGWITLQTYTSYDRLGLMVDGVPIQVSLKDKCFCGTPCLTFHIGKTVADAVTEAKDEAAGVVEMGGEEAVI